MSQPIKGYRIFFGAYDKVFALLQSLYDITNTPPSKLPIQRAVYRNSLLCVLASILRRPEDRTKCLFSLSHHIESNASVDGLETVLLSLLGGLDGQDTVFSKGQTLWDKYCKKGQVPGAGPMAFYDFKTNEMRFLTRRGVLTLRKEGLGDHPEDMRSRISDLPSRVLTDPFGVVVNPLPTLASVHVLDAVTDRDKKMRDAWNEGAKVIGGILVLGGVILELFPGGQIAGSAALITGLAIESFVEYQEFNEKMQDLEQKEVPRSEEDVPTPADIPTGSVVEADNGEVGICDIGGDEVAGSDDGGDAGGDGGNDGGGCFVADTPVWMADGSRRSISTIEVGDTIQARFPDGHVGLAIVSKVHRHENQETLALCFDKGEQITTTNRHRFWLNSASAFVPAQSLASMTTLNTESADEVMLLGSSQGLPATVFNLTVDQAHTYFVGEFKLLVHNRKDADPEEPWG
ncbi:hypothetical protein DER46DRAFT_681458 [Fusarium sp. MPI-SDFR-AT-0072]|nr:hypothetical protein DER46DRAFT_681458 [Fusarium sp. MPI-SDFR-AT-0072]